MIAALGASVAKTNEEFVWRHGLTYLDIRSNAEVCHIPPGLNRRPDVDELAIALFCTKRIVETTEIFRIKTRLSTLSSAIFPAEAQNPSGKKCVRASLR